MTELELKKIVAALEDIAIVLRRMDNKLEKIANRVG